MSHVLRPVILGLFLASALAGCEDAQPGDPQEEGVVSGIVVDGAGRPLPGAEVVINNAVWHASNIVLRSDADGRFRHRMPATDSWYVRGTIQREYHGLTYTLPLHPSRDEAFAGVDGATCDLTLKISGPVPTSFGGAGTYGGTIVVNNYTFDDIDLDQIEVTLTPTDTLVDGTQGQVLRRKLVRGAEGHVFEDVPLGRYRIAAKDLVTGAALALRHRRAGEPQAEVTLDFEPSYPGATRYAIPLAVSLR